MKPAIRIENLSKQYRLGLVGTGTLSHDLKRWWYLIRGKEDPYLKIGETNDRATKGNSQYVWALKDINLEVMPGEVLGIIGKNGAGKSTLLKILSKVTGPTTGTIDYKGRIGSLLEVGTGFHPELTGRENIYLNGAILGMRKKEIDRKFDEIVDFSGVERYIDTPTKRYSSGMTVRLGFAVAAFLEPEILVVDEVLAVGDAEFQKKAIGKMQDVSKNDGRTVLFVSHNMGAVKTLCPTSILLDKGSILKIGATEKVVELYLDAGLTKNKHWVKTKALECLHFNKISLKATHGTQPNITLVINIELEINKSGRDGILALDIVDEQRVPIFQSIANRRIKNVKGKQKFEMEIILPPLIPGEYYIDAWIGPHNTETYDSVESAICFRIEDSPLNNWTFPFSKNHGHFVINSKLIDEKDS